MIDPVEKVRRIMGDPEDVDLPEDVVAEPQPGDGGDTGGVPPPPAPPPQDEGEPEPPEHRCAEFPLNDYGNGLRLVEHFGQNLQHVPRVGYHVWDGARFRLDPDEIAVRRLAHKMSDLIAREIWHIPLSEAEDSILSEAEAMAHFLDEIGAIPPKNRTEDQIEQLLRAQKLKEVADEIKDRRDKSIGRRLTHAKNAGNTNGIRNMMTEAAAILARPIEEFDADPLVINTLAGALRFWTEPGEDDGGQYEPRPVGRFELMPHAREQLLTKVMPVEYDPAAQCPGFISFLERVQPLPEMRRFIQRWAGYSMTGLVGEQKFAFFYGDGNNGKSVLNDVLARIMGDYAASAKIESITGKNRRGGGDATPDLMPLVGARMVRTSEPEEGARLQEGLIKELTGGEPILVRALNQNFILIYPIFKLTISGNHKPEIHGGDEGIWRRVLLVPWPVQIPKDEIDKDLTLKLFEERAGILNWLIAGLLDYLSGGLQVPEQVMSATQEYREDSDPLATFLTLCCAVTGNPEHAMRAKDLTMAFALWLDEGGRGAWTDRTIFKRLKAKAGRWKHPQSGQTFVDRKSSESWYDGIALIEPFRTRFEEHRMARDRARMRHDDGGML